MLFGKLKLMVCIVFFNWGALFQLSACSDRGSFANPHFRRILTPWISPLDMFFGGDRGMPLVMLLFLLRL